MNTVLVVGAETITGNAIASQFAADKSVETICLSTRSENAPRSFDSIDSYKFTTESDVDVVFFCGGAAKSSWDADFGDFESETKWLKQCVEYAKSTNSHFVYISSDAVFAGPWVFHGDRDTTYGTSQTSKAILKWERLASSASKHLIVRCNVLGLGMSGFLDDLDTNLRGGVNISLDARTSATILMAEDFAKALAGCIERQMTGYMNIAGGERTTPFLFANQLAGQLNSGSQILADTTGQLAEHSLRCERLRNESISNPPLMQETLERLVHAIEQQLQKPLAVAA